MKPKNKTIYAVIVFYSIAIGVRYLTNKTEIFAGVNINFFKIILQGIGPTIGVIIACLLFKIKFQPMTLKGDYKQVWSPFLIYWAFPIVLISLQTFITKSSFPIVTVFACFIYGLLEEIGWRGFLQQQLKELPRIWNILLVGILWFIWHLNFELTTANMLFLGLLILGSWGIGVVADRTNALLAVSAFHSLNNVKTNENMLMIGILFVVWIAAVMYFIRKRNKKINNVKM